MVNIYNIPVYNFSGWMLILAYATIFILIGRWWFKPLWIQASRLDMRTLSWRSFWR